MSKAVSELNALCDVLSPNDYDAADCVEYNVIDKTE